MLTPVVFLLLAQFDVNTARPSAEQVEAAHQLLNGEWAIVSYTDDGEAIGTGLLRAKLAKDARITISDRALRVVNPETNEVRVTPFRVNPLRSPRQIEVTTRDDRTVGGIYKFEGDDLLVCLETQPDTGYPASFDAPAGSGRRLIRLRMISSQPAPAAPEMIHPGDVTPTSAPLTPEQHATRVTFATARKPTESELARVRDLFAGNWQIESIVDDGETLGAELIRRRFAEDGRIRFGTRSFAIVNPRTEERRVSSYRVDPTRTPSEIDVTTQFDSVLKGIYTFEGDRLSLCLAKHEDGPRPDAFEAPGGSGRLLLHLRLGVDDPPIRSVSQVQAQPKPEPKPEPRPKPSPEAAAREQDAKIRRMIAGSWTLNDTRGQLTAVFQPDGLFVSTRTWARGARRLFGPASDSSNGTWSYRDGVLAAWVSGTTDPRIAGHQLQGRVQTIGEDTMVLTDVYGSVKTFRRLR